MSEQDLGLQPEEELVSPKEAATSSGSAEPQPSLDQMEQPEDLDVQELLQELEKQKALAQQHYDQWMRTYADFENFRRRSRAERDDFIKYACEQLVTNLLPVIDNFERALAAADQTSDVQALTTGIEMVFRQLIDILQKEGLSSLEAVGQEFDPQKHEAFMQIPADEQHQDGIIVEEFQKGYLFKDKVIRPARVSVAKARN